MKNESFEKIKSILKNDNLVFYNKLTLNLDYKQNDFVVVSFENNILHRNLYKARLPFYPKFKTGYEKLVNPSNSYENKSYIPKEEIPFEFILKHSTKQENKEENNFKYPVEIDGKNIARKQSPYYFTNSLNKITCKKCDGDGLITCDDYECQGKHEWECDNCIGEGKISCKSCDGEGWNTCGNCRGRGKIKERIKAANGNTKEVFVNCGKCSGKGKVKCLTCNTSGKVICSKCDGRKKIECLQCYSDKKRYGLIDCPSCEAQGEFILFDYVHSEIENNDIRRILPFGENLSFDIKELEKYFGQLSNKEIIFNQVNEKIDKTQEILPYLEKLRPEFKFEIDDYPLLLNELISYKVISCIEFSYNHIISNKEHKGVIINFNENPEVFYYDNPETLKTDIKAVSKSAFNIFSKIFKTKSSKIKNDQLIEVKLMIYLAKQDGKIEEEEKLVILNTIKEMKELTNAEKSKFFKLMDTASLPEITSKDLKFSSKEVANEVIGRLENLAISDGELEDVEKDFIEKIKNLIS